MPDAETHGQANLVYAAFDSVVTACNCKKALDAEPPDIAPDILVDFYKGAAPSGPKMKVLLLDGEPCLPAQPAAPGPSPTTTSALVTQLPPDPQPHSSLQQTSAVNMHPTASSPLPTAISTLYSQHVEATQVKSGASPSQYMHNTNMAGAAKDSSMASSSSSFLHSTDSWPPHSSSTVPFQQSAALQSSSQTETKTLLHAQDTNSQRLDRFLSNISALNSRTAQNVNAQRSLPSPSSKSVQPSQHPGATYNYTQDTTQAAAPQYPGAKPSPSQYPSAAQHKSETNSVNPHNANWPESAPSPSTTSILPSHPAAATQHHNQNKAFGNAQNSNSQYSSAAQNANFQHSTSSQYPSNVQSGNTQGSAPLQYPSATQNTNLQGSTPSQYLSAAKVDNSQGSTSSQYPSAGQNTCTQGPTPSQYPLAEQNANPQGSAASHYSNATSQRPPSSQYSTTGQNSHLQESTPSQYPSGGQNANSQGSASSQYPSAANAQGPTPSQYPSTAQNANFQESSPSQYLPAGQNSNSQVSAPSQYSLVGQRGSTASQYPSTNPSQYPSSR
mmetsp:Transcript_41659/g.53690  ORF Transcript_41659/g.53690 Transcript_41659/m.53690 type:complete len:556 (+) Transcript_41659:3-1670(+)